MQLDGHYNDDYDTEPWQNNVALEEHNRAMEKMNTLRGWDLMGGDRGKWHCFGTDSRSLCGKWANLTRNKLAWDVHPDNQCAACRRKFEKSEKQSRVRR